MPNTAQSALRQRDEGCFDSPREIFHGRPRSPCHFAVAQRRGIRYSRDSRITLECTRRARSRGASLQTVDKLKSGTPSTHVILPPISPAGRSLPSHHRCHCRPSLALRPCRLAASASRAVWKVTAPRLGGRRNPRVCIGPTSPIIRLLDSTGTVRRRAHPFRRAELRLGGATPRESQGAAARTFRHRAKGERYCAINRSRASASKRG